MYLVNFRSMETIFKDSTLSWGAKGIYYYMLKNRKGRYFEEDENALYEFGSYECEVDRAFMELKEGGYIKFVRVPA
jgi:hypothetical protein